MNGFRRKLRQFKSTWMEAPQRPPRRPRAMVGFLCNADDTPRGWTDDGGLQAARAALPPPALPRFRDLAVPEPRRHAA